jgi:hypothetical protein
MIEKRTLRWGLLVTSVALASAFLLLAIGSARAAKSVAPTSNTFTVTGSMNVARYNHKTVLLSTGQVLAVTGDVNGTNTAELYNPATGKWTLTGSPAAFHEGGSLTLLAHGEVLLAGGDDPLFSTTAFTTAAELYNPATGQWSMTGAMTSARRYQAAVLLPNGEVLVAGGQDPTFSSLSSAELYNPATGAWQAAASMRNSRSNAVAELLGNGSVLVAGGFDYSNGSFISSLASGEVFNPSTAEWASTASMPGAGGSQGSLLANGEVLVVRDAFFNPGADAWTATGPFLRNTVGPSTATLLGTGEVLMTGLRSTYNDTPSLNTTVLYNFATNSYVTAAPMNSTRYSDAATLLPNGQVLISGGYRKGVGIGLLPLSTAELYTP